MGSEQMMDQKTKLFLSDVDGTLLKTRSAVPREVIHAINRFMTSGGKFALSTGRCLKSAKRLVSEVPVNAPCILCGGALIYDFQKEQAIQAHILDDDVFEKIGRVLKEYSDVSVTITTCEEVYNIRKNDRLRTRGVEEDANAAVVPLRDIRKPVKVLFTNDDPAVLTEIYKRWFDSHLYTFSFASRCFCELTARGADKGSAAAYLAGLYGDCRVFTAGDALSDVYMAQNSEQFFAPTSAPEEVRKYADRLFLPPQEGGIAEVIDFVRKLADERSGPGD